ncbi:hypothetical protein V8B97DRAFT_1894991 [Scleroderma yunnanense]
MSAYGTIHRAPRTSYLPSTIWPWPEPASHLDSSQLQGPNLTLSDPIQRNVQISTISIHHVDEDAVIQAHEGLFEYLHSVFVNEVDKGTTYPQEDIHDPTIFASYFFAADVIIAIAGTGDEDAMLEIMTEVVDEPGTTVKEVGVSLDEARRGRSWEECVIGFYYVKPNYPGRSSHICNAGFVVPESQRGHGYGRVLAKSYLYYAPRLGYQASVFNLVYVNNQASIRLWDKLGFTKAGLIPKAGRLKRLDGNGEEYVDAWVYYKSFVDHSEGTKGDGQDAITL